MANATNMRVFGRLPDGQQIEEYTLDNGSGFRARIITYGATITQLHVPDGAGKSVDVVLGFDDLSGYLGKHPFFGCTVGRVAGRITNGRFTLDGKDYQLERNDPPNHLHGGSKAFDKRLWTVQASDSTSVTLRYNSPDGEAGYPGNVGVEVRYQVTDDNELVISYEATTDRATLLSLTNHSYFNLSCAGTIENHQVQIHSGEVAAADERTTLLGRLIPVDDTNDFRKPKRLGDMIPRMAGQHGDSYMFGTEPVPIRLIAKVAAAGRVMEVLSTEPTMQLYCAAILDGSLTGKSGARYPRFGGVCLECQRYPDGINTPELGDPTLHAGEVYRQTTIYRFGVSQ